MGERISFLVSCFIVFFVFWAAGFTNELHFMTVIISTIVFGYGIHHVWKLYKKFQANLK